MMQGTTRKVVYETSTKYTGDGGGLVVAIFLQINFKQSHVLQTFNLKLSGAFSKTCDTFLQHI